MPELESLRPAIAAILYQRVATIEAPTEPGALDPGLALIDGGNLLIWVDQREALELDDQRDATIAELESERDEQADRIDALEVKLAAAERHVINIRAELGKLTASLPS